MKNQKDNVDLICSISELLTLFNKSARLENFLQKVVEMIAAHMRASVCSVYLYNKSNKQLMLSATVGLNPDAIGRVTLALGEGIAGLALHELRPILESRGAENPNYKFIPGTGEEKYQAFLAVPLLRGLERLGVLVLQHEQSGYFNENDVMAIKAIAGQLSTTIENAQLFINMHQQESGGPDERQQWNKSKNFFKGTPASGGITRGKTAKIFGAAHSLQSHLEDEQTYTLQDFKTALQKTIDQLVTLQKEMEEQLYDVASMIFSSHILMLKDNQFSMAIEERITGGTPPVQAIINVVEQYVDMFANSRNMRLREKVQDMYDLGHRLLSNLSDRKDTISDYSNHVIICDDLLPSELFKLAAQKASGILVINANMTAHIAILARSLSIPVIFCHENQLLNVPENIDILIDGHQGLVFLEPDSKVMDNYAQLLKIQNEKPQVTDRTTTRDGEEVFLYANVNLLSELLLVNQFKAAGIGLYRSEFPFIIRDTFPSEEEQVRIYEKIFKEMAGKEVTLRTLDVGGDKMLSYYSHVDESNPFLGLRAIRFSLQNRDIFKQQLRAMLRAGKGNFLKIMFPLVSSLDDFLLAKKVVEECKQELDTGPAAAAVQIGAMIELPSAAEIADVLAKHADFISIGTNDLVQYILGVDRTNEKIADLYIAHHPAVIRTLNKILQKLTAAEKSPTLCGEMAHDRYMLPFLLGIGVRRFSVAPALIPVLQSQIQKIDLEKARKLASDLLSLDRITEIEKRMGIKSEQV